MCLPSQAQNTSDYLIFPSVTILQHSRVPTDSGMERAELEPAVALIYSAQREHWRLFGEFNLHGDSGEITRLQAGWNLDERTTLWVGRFHSLLGYWNTQYHHGVYLQPSIHRPGIAEFDDHGGIMPSHFTGAELSSEQPVTGGGALRYELGFGRGGELSDGLNSPGLFSDQLGGNTASLRLTYYPQEGYPDAVGVFWGRNDLPASGAGFSEVKQNVAGVFGNIEFERWRFISAVYVLDNTLLGGVTLQDGTLVSAYLHTEYSQWNDRSLYMRVEGTGDSGGDPYLALFHHFVNRRVLAGVRLDLSERQTLKLEAAQAGFADGPSAEFGLQWSMVYP